MIFLSYYQPVVYAAYISSKQSRHENRSYIASRTRLRVDKILHCFYLPTRFFLSVCLTRMIYIGTGTYYTVFFIATSSSGNGKKNSYQPVECRYMYIYIRRYLLRNVYFVLANDTARIATIFFSVYWISCILNIRFMIYTYISHVV